MAYTVVGPTVQATGTVGFYDSAVSTAINIAADGCDEINSILQDVSYESKLGDLGAGSESQTPAHAAADTAGAAVLTKYAISLPSGGLSINSAAGAMVVDDLMQKISTKVQVAAQLLSTANNIAKTATRIMQQG